MEIKLKIRENLFIKGGHTIISYETEVAKIKDRKIIEVGKFSRATTRHIYSVASMFQYTVESNKDRKDFWKFEMGIKTSQGQFTLSEKLSHEIVESLKSGMNWFQALVLCHPKKKKDKETLEVYFKGIGYDIKNLQDSRDLGIIFG